MCAFCGLLFIFSLLLISVAVSKMLRLLTGFAGLLPVVSWVLMLNSLIINAIHFSGWYALSGWF
jgi:hypothetical protein